MAINTRNYTMFIHGNKGCIHFSTVTDQAVAWISLYSKNIGDYYPRSAKFYIPHCYTYSDLYHIYISEMRGISNTSKVLNKPWFCKVMKKCFPQVHLASKLMLGFCDECITLTEARLKASNEEEKAAYQRAQALHFELQRGERVAYQRRKLQASTDPHGCWSVIIDFTDRYTQYQ